MSAFESKKYSWKSGFAYSTSADTVGKVLEKIEKRDGKVTAKSFLAESKKKSSPTHSMFEWDDAKAANKYRLQQSAQIINQLEITLEDGNSAPAFVNVRIKSVKQSASFLNVQTALSDEEYSRIVLQNALSELLSFQKKYNGLKELSDVFASIKSLQEQMA